MASIRVYKLDEQGDEVWHYDGEVLFRDPTTVKLQAYFSRADIVLDFHTFRRGDRMVEWFFNGYIIQITVALFMYILVNISR